MTSTLRNTVLALGLSLGLLAACSSSDGGGSGGSGGSDSGGKGGSSSGGSAGSSSGGKGGSAGGNSGGSGGNSGGSSGGVTFDADILPIFMAKCTPCHQKGNPTSTFTHTMASDYTKVQKISAACPGKKEGECSIVRIKSGEMPQGAGCSGKPDMDKDNNKCLTQAEQDKVQAWIDGGLLEK